MTRILSRKDTENIYTIIRDPSVSSGPVPISFTLEYTGEGR